MVDAASLQTMSFNPLTYMNIGNPYTLLLDILALIFAGAMLYFFFFREKKLRYHVQIYERENNGVPIPVDTDVLEEKQLNKGANTMYWLRKNKCEAHPPTSKFIYKRNAKYFGTEMWIDYVRERNEFIPVRRQIELGLRSDMDIAVFHKRMLEIWESKPSEVRQKFVFSPLIPAAMPALTFEPLAYNLNEMLQTKIAHRATLYADKQNWMQTYGPMLGIGLAAVTIIVVGYLGYQFASQNINSVILAANTVATKLGDVASTCLLSQQPPAPPAG